jgi:hypothetical protein
MVKFLQVFSCGHKVCQLQEPIHGVETSLISKAFLIAGLIGFAVTWKEFGRNLAKFFLR